MGSLFQKRDAVDEKDFGVAIDVFLNGADMVIEEEDRSDREGVYLGRIWARYKGWWWCSTLKAVDYCHAYRFCCFSGHWSGMNECGPDVEIRCLRNLGIKLIERHMRV